MFTAFVPGIGVARMDRMWAGELRECLQSHIVADDDKMDRMPKEVGCTVWVEEECETEVVK
jgi:hypothetical protein